MSSRTANLAFCAILAAFAFLHLYRVGVLGLTWDEGGDLAIVRCIQGGDPFRCLEDISQTRVPFYIHALAGKTESRVHYAVSVVFSLATLLMTYVWARRRYGAGVATVTGALYVLSPPLLASGRMLLTHSNAIFTFFTTAGFLAAFEFARTERRGWLYVCAVAAGLSAASHPLGVFNGLVLVAVYLTVRRRSWRDLLFFPVAAMTFFATTLIYVVPKNFRALVDACLHGGDWPFWNYFGTGSAAAPWWFPFVVLFVKFTPWWLALALAYAWRAKVDRVLLAFAAAFFVNLVLKGAVFHYETPHHQVQFYPVLFVIVALVLSRAWKPLVAVAFVLSIWDVARFFPHYLFYGAQYGERFIGEFYGPASLHGQDRGATNREIDAILAREPEAQFLVADHNMLERTGPSFVPFSQRDPNVVYRYAVVDRLYGAHFDFPERDPFNALLAREYRLAFTHEWPPGVWVYRIYTR